MTTNLFKTRIMVLALAAIMAPASSIVATPALAYDDDVEVVCGDTDDGDIWCETIDDLAAQCERTDPEYTGEECQGLLESRPIVIVPSVLRDTPNNGGGFSNPRPRTVQR